jgi:hypothetical protein
MPRVRRSPPSQPTRAGLTHEVFGMNDEKEQRLRDLPILIGEGPNVKKLALIAELRKLARLKLDEIHAQKLLRKR